MKTEKYLMIPYNVYKEGCFCRNMWFYLQHVTNLRVL